MTLEMEIGEALHDSFRAALVLTGSIEAAEHAVTGAIAAIGPDLSPDALLLETARSALQHGRLKSSPVLPLELQAVALLQPTYRYCFVLRFLMRFDLETCSEVLRLSRDEVAEALYQSLQELPRAVESVRSTVRMTEANVAIGQPSKETLDRP